MTYEAFVRTVEERAGRSSFLLALYQTLDEYHLFEEEQRLTESACCKSCSLCCHQMICVYPEEMELIHAHIRRQVSPVRRKLRERIREGIGKWREYFERHRFSPQRLHNPLQLAEDWFGEPCPLLQEDGTCSVYEVRPLVCRTTTSPTRCTELSHLGDEEHSVQMRYSSDQWANQLFTERMFQGGAEGVVPMHHLFTLQQFKV